MDRIPPRLNRSEPRQDEQSTVASASKGAAARLREEINHQCCRCRTRRSSAQRNPHKTVLVRTNQIEKPRYRQQSREAKFRDTARGRKKRKSPHHKSTTNNRQKRARRRRGLRTLPELADQQRAVLERRNGAEAEAQRAAAVPVPRTRNCGMVGEEGDERALKPRTRRRRGRALARKLP